MKFNPIISIQDAEVFYYKEFKTLGEMTASFNFMTGRPSNTALDPAEMTMIDQSVDRADFSVAAVYVVSDMQPMLSVVASVKQGDYVVTHGLDLHSLVFRAYKEGYEPRALNSLVDPEMFAPMVLHTRNFTTFQGVLATYMACSASEYQNVIDLNEMKYKIEEGVAPLMCVEYDQLKGVCRYWVEYYNQDGSVASVREKREFAIRRRVYRQA